MYTVHTHFNKDRYSKYSAVWWFVFLFSLFIQVNQVYLQCNHLSSIYYPKLSLFFDLVLLTNLFYNPSSKKYTIFTRVSLSIYFNPPSFQCQYWPIVIIIMKMKARSFTLHRKENFIAILTKKNPKIKGKLFTLIILTFLLLTNSTDNFFSFLYAVRWACLMKTPLGSQQHFCIHAICTQL